MVDHFTKWLELFPPRNQKAETVARKVFDGWIPRHGAPGELHHDQGKNLSAKMMEEVCSFLEVWNTCTTPFHPQSDGGLEKKHSNGEQHAGESGGRGPEKLGLVCILLVFRLQHCGT